MRCRHSKTLTTTKIDNGFLRLITCKNQRRTFATNEESKRQSLAVEEEYSRKTPIEHVLLRPGMYVGPSERMPPQAHWILENPPPKPPEELSTMPLYELKFPEEKWNSVMVKRPCALVPALVKVFDEILVNASDNRLRHPKSCTRMDVVVDPGTENRNSIIRVFNDGKGIPVRVHQKENMYVPELLFGHLMTGSNFDDTTKRVTGGRHGYGAKLTNIFSKSFTVEVADCSAKKLYAQTWRDNMSKAGSPSIIPYNGRKDFTCISFVPDLERLTDTRGAAVIEEDDYAMICRRVLDIAGCAAGQLRVSLNGLDVTVPSFDAYLKLYPSGENMIFQSINKRWSVGVGLSTDSEFESVSFVNGISTDRGGTHVSAITSQITKEIQTAIAKMDEGLPQFVTPQMVKRHLFVAVDSLIENPTFDSQMKEKLTTSAVKFGSSCSLPPMFLSKLVKKAINGGPGIVEKITEAAESKQKESLKKVVGKKQSKRQMLAIDKLDDAHLAGSNEGWKCTIILTEGDSAKALAIAGLEVIGRQHFGVFPLRGKLLNVRHASLKQLTANAEVTALCKIMGLDFDKEYKTIKERRLLRYGRVMLMADQDKDGSHIKGLVINFFKHFWPHLLRPAVDRDQNNSGADPDFLSVFITPLLKARKGNKETLSFYSEAEYEKWKADIGSDFSKFKIKYYKGLGTSTPAEAKEYFAAFDRHVRTFQWHSERDDELLDMAFDKERAADRRDWINETYDETSGIYSDHDTTTPISFQDFINKELVHFSHGDNIRSIPSAIDGLKPSQRKVLFACFKRNLQSEVKVAQLSGYCAEHTAYHHGEASLQSTIVGMAQDFVGSNNINLLVPSGQFGTRLTGGEDAASPRYIFTHLSPITRVLFPEADDQLLRYLEDDGQTIEPQFYCPIIPLLLVNGSTGIGTGWSTGIPPHNPFDIVKYVRAKLDGKVKLPEINPYVRGFKGTLEKDGNGYTSVGKVAEKRGELHIEELPVGCWTNDYKNQLLTFQEKGVISSFSEDNTTTKISFTVNLAKGKLEDMMRLGLTNKLKLTSRLGTTNMHAFDDQGILAKFDNPRDIVERFFPVRLSLYDDRLSVLKSESEYSAMILRNQARFIQKVVHGEINLVDGRSSIPMMNARLSALGFDSSAKLEEVKNNNAIGKRNQQRANSEEKDPFNYILKLPVSSFTSERIAEIEEEAKKTDRRLKEIQATTSRELWHQELSTLVKFLPKV
ncbi:hypothetical protein ACA910_010777 [Epithemia clementina (nom. ined.)]